MIVDAIYGTGFHGELDEKHETVAKIINIAVAAVFALDIPSGLSADEPGATEKAVKADFTIVFDSLKTVHVIRPYNERAGRLRWLRSGFPKRQKKRSS
jgi:NAD(P)H-hydrate epimerase